MMSDNKTHILGTVGKIFGWTIVVAIVLVALFSGLWILLGAAIIMALGLWAGEGKRLRDGHS